ncbi:MAG: radical SAM protein [Candidatus Omnitrophica bacterium]|nr:radical SAM protein [Candidatus Omnitrophota bacterium]
MCFNWQKIDDFRNRHELTLVEIDKISRGLKNLLYLTISGGEPTLRDDLSEIIKIFTQRNKVQFVTLPTNGVMPSRICDLVDKILYENPKVSFRIVLSLDGVGDLHDEIRGLPGNFNRVLETYNRLDHLRSKYNNFDLDVNTVLSNYNCGRVKEIIDFVDRTLNVDNHVLALARGNTREPQARRFTVEDAEEAIHLIEERSVRNSYRRRDSGRGIIKVLKLRMRDMVLETLKKNRAVIPCLAGRKMIIIDDIGDLYPCELLDKKIASLRAINFNMEKALFSSEAKKIKDWIIKTKCFCTFECALQASAVFNLREVLHLFAKFIKVKRKSFIS